MPEPVTPLKDTTELREEMIKSCRYLSDIGFCIGTWGNMSVRVEEGFLITPSKVDYYTMTPDDIVLCNWAGVRIKGTRPPSSEMELHRTLLKRRPDFGAVVHTHSPYASAASAAPHSIPVTTEDTAQIIGGEVKCAKYVSGAEHVELAEAAWEAIGDTCAAVLLRNHGPVVGGRDINEAVTAARVLEKAALIFFHTTALGGYVSIPEKQVAEERHRFLYKYGKE